VLKRVKAQRAKYVPLHKVISVSTSTTEAARIRHEKKKKGTKWKDEVAAILKKEGFTRKAFEASVRSSNEKVPGLLSREAAIMALLLLRLEAGGQNLKKLTTLLQVNPMPKRSHILKNTEVAPCICPQAQYIVWHNGHARRLQPTEYLHLQVCDFGV